MAHLFRFTSPAKRSLPGRLTKARAFTLIELIMVLVLTSIVALIAQRFIVLSTASTLNAGQRGQLAQNAALINQQLSQALRQALPASVRISDDQACVEYIPVLAASRLLDENIAGQSISQFQAVPYSRTEAVDGFIAVYPQQGDDLYSQSNNASISAQSTRLNAGSAAVTVSLSPAHQFLRQPPSQRFFITSAPQAFCQQGSDLFHYQNYGFIADIDNLAANLPENEAQGRSLLATQLEPGSLVFSFAQASLQRNGVLAFHYRLTGLSAGLAANSLELSQEVQLRNVP